MTLPGIIKPETAGYVKALIFGPGGYGKTTFLGTAQEDKRTYPMLLLDYEGNTESLMGLDIDIKRIRSWQDFNDTLAYLRKGEHGYKSLGIDSISEINFWALNNQMEEHAANRDEPDQPQLQDFGRTLVQMRRVLRVFRDLPMHVFYTAIDDSESEPGEGTVKFPLMVGQMKKEVGALMAVVGCLAMQEDRTTKTKERVLLLHDIPRYRVKARTKWQQHDSIPEILTNPTVGRLLDVIPHGKEKT